jgi:hypothetical protein
MMGETFDPRSWVSGMRVIHPKFGAGSLVMLSHLKGTLHMATVEFDDGRRETFDIDGSGMTREQPVS